MSAEQVMCYVAADPAQPGTAWAATVDDPSSERKKDNAKEIAQWLLDGANVMRVDVETARQMLISWVRKDSPEPTEPPTLPLFTEAQP